MISKHELMEVLGWLGFTAQDFASAMSGASSREHAVQRLEALKRRIRKAGKRLYRELHPDLNSGPGAEERQKRMSRLTDALEALEHIEVFVRRPRVRVVTTFDGFNNTATNGFNDFNGFHSGGG